MKILFFLAILVLGTITQAQEDSLEEPPLQTGEDVGDFLNQIGAPPKNQNSAVVGGVQMSAPFLQGNGCPDGTVGAALTPDNKTLSLLFDNYVVLAGQSVGVKRSVKNCTLFIPVNVPAGFQFTVVKLDYRGFNSIPKNGRTRYVSIYSFLDGQNGKDVSRRVRRRTDFRGPLQENYIISSDVASKPIWSPCGSKVQLRVDTRAVAVSNGKNEDVMATIDSIDSAVGTSAEYHFLWRECGGKGKNPPPLPPFPKFPKIWG